jgi:hypothetical protein
MYAVVSTKFLICRGVVTIVDLNYPSKNRGHNLPLSLYKLSFRLGYLKVRLIKILFYNFINVIHEPKIDKAQGQASAVTAVQCS